MRKCVVDAGWITSERQSPTLARCEKIFSASMKALPCLREPLRSKLNTAPQPRGSSFLRQRMAGVAFRARGSRRAATIAWPARNSTTLPRVGDVARHAQRQGLDALQDQPGGVRAHAGAEVAQPFAARAQQEGADGALLAEHHVVEAVVGLRSAPAKRCRCASQSKLPPSTSRPPITVPWPRQELGGRVVDQVGAVVEGLHQPRRGEGRVHQQRHAGLVRDGGDAWGCRARPGPGCRASRRTAAWSRAGSRRASRRCRPA